MPCRDDYNDLTIGRDRLDELHTAEAILCGVLTVLDDREKAGFLGGDGYPIDLDAVFTLVDWNECGVTSTEARSWWKNHMAKDLARKKKEAEEEETRRAIARAKAKLTLDEIELLGIEL